ncbi:probable inactive receptor kinase At4g23740 isoform X1 [Arachis ipaensis]|uniref:probable inactive receptor kinase At4g23740 isoform X1 n=2 Tax=Arachis ipaensis TaxID=130454 RepID=UPI0007AF3A86|nr:probable inactive receptor kinase At4g23740 isoform X1 [Arachis ipaensis]
MSYFANILRNDLQTKKMDKKLCLLFIFSASILFIVGAEPVEDKQALLDFLHNMNHPYNLNWNENSSVCTSWRGVTCNAGRSRVIALRLPAAGLSGQIPNNTLGHLSELQILSLHSNGITGPFPNDFSELKNLTSLYLQSNKISGPLPLNFSVWNSLTILNLSNNFFNGTIPFSISNMTHLESLILANNSLSGEIPDLNIPSLKELDLANNNLSGVVPKSLLRFPIRDFAGNNNLTYGNALSPAIPLQPPNDQPAKKKHNRISEQTLLAIIIGACVLGFAVVAAFMIACMYEKSNENELPVESKKKEVPLKKQSSDSQESQDKNKIVFFEGCSLAFDLEDLLRASAEILGKGTFGMTYKASLDENTTVVVKRLKEVTAGKREFEQQMEIVGRIKHDNVDALRAYYYSKEEKLIVYDFYQQGSVSALLHGKRGEGRIPLDWESRLRIAIGAARAIAHIHAQHGGKLVHGNIKASNIFLNSQGYGCVSDTGLATLMSPLPAPATRAAGYRAPEVTDTRKSTHASDVYAFGVLVLELLTGKSPVPAAGGEEVMHLVRWVNSVVREEWTAEVFDVELLRYPNIEEEMVEMLQIGMACASRIPDQRPNMTEVVRMMEEIRRVNTGNPPSTGSRSEVSTPTTYAVDMMVASTSAM